jgi:mono/diheme cytochrome c family protein
MRFLVVLALSLVMAGPATAQTPVERGKYLVEVLGACGNCHSPKTPTGEAPGKHLAGGFELDEAFGVAVASNITPDPETGIGRWTDAQIVRAIREGKSRDGRTLGPPMPFYLYRGLSDRDVRAIVAYLRTVPPVKNAVAPSRYKVPIPKSYGPPIVRVSDPPVNDPVKYGAYLAGPVAHCADCHTPRNATGGPDTAKLFAGGFHFAGPFGVSYSTNLTPDKETGIGAWTDAQIIAAINGTDPRGRPVMPPMPWPYYAGKVAERDLAAIVAYLRSLRPIRNPVPPSVPASGPPPVPAATSPPAPAPPPTK